MNQDPNNPIAPNPIVPETPINPAAAAAPTLSAAPASTVDPTIDAAPVSNAMPTLDSTAPSPTTPEATPAVPEVPTLDASLLQQAIADVPEEATATAPNAPSAVPLNDLNTVPDATATPNTEPTPFTGAAPSANFTTPEAGLVTNQSPAMDPTTNTPIVGEEATKTTPSVAFNDPAQQPDAAKHSKDINFSGLLEKIKKRPVLAIVGGGALIIIVLVLVLAFAI